MMHSLWCIDQQKSLALTGNLTRLVGATLIFEAEIADTPAQAKVAPSHHPSPISLHLVYIMTAFRLALKSIPRATSSSLVRPTPLLLRAPISRTIPQPLLVRGYAASAGLTKDDIKARIMEVMRDFEKVNAAKVGQSICPSQCPISTLWNVPSRRK